jgi:regulatory protein YycI of two-component signal transduction system YycFG
MPSNKDPHPRCPYRIYTPPNSTLKIQYVTMDDILFTHGQSFFEQFKTLARGDTCIATEDGIIVIYYCDYLNHRSQILSGKSLFWD